MSEKITAAPFSSYSYFWCEDLYSCFLLFKLFSTTADKSNKRTAWYGIFKQVYTSTIGSTLGVEARTSMEKKKAEKLKSSTRGLKSLNNSKFITNFLITSILSILWMWMLFNVMEEGEIHSFDPFTILGIDSGADTKVIKKAYRSKSLQYHPDKNPGDKLAETMFMNIAKAYESLTDPTAKENYRLYGNPDGKQSMEVSIGLPTFLLDEHNKFLILLIYLTLMVGVVPYWVWKYYSNSSQMGENNIMYDTYSWFYHALSKDITVRHIPGESFCAINVFLLQNLFSGLFDLYLHFVGSNLSFITLSDRIQ